MSNRFMHVGQHPWTKSLSVQAQASNHTGWHTVPEPLKICSNLLHCAQSVTLGDDEAKRINNGEKVKLRRKGSPVFNVLIEVQSNHR